MADCRLICRDFFQRGFAATGRGLSDGPMASRRVPDPKSVPEFPAHAKVGAPAVFLHLAQTFALAVIAFEENPEGLFGQVEKLRVDLPVTGELVPDRPVKLLEVVHKKILRRAATQRLAFAQALGVEIEREPDKQPCFPISQPNVPDLIGLANERHGLAGTRRIRRLAVQKGDVGHDAKAIERRGQRTDCCW